MTVESIGVCLLFLGLVVAGVVLLVVAYRAGRKGAGRGERMGVREVEAEFHKLKAQFNAGSLSEDDFKARLQDLMIRDTQGRWWMIGYESGLWYVHDGERWVSAQPPTEDQVATLPRSPRGRSEGARWLWGALGLILLLAAAWLLANNFGLLP